MSRQCIDSHTLLLPHCPIFSYNQSCYNLQSYRQTISCLPATSLLRELAEIARGENPTPTRTWKLSVIRWPLFPKISALEKSAKFLEVVTFRVH